MIEINLNNINKYYGTNEVLNNITFEIKTKDKVSLIGDNGCGKTTILNIIAGIENPNNGNISIRKRSTIGYLSQEPEKTNNNKIVKDILYESVKEILDIEKVLNKYEEKMRDNPNNIEIINKYLNTQERFINAGGYEINSLIEKVTHGLEINNFVNKEYNELSGGEQKRVMLAALIIKKPNILILDEPTNHLDIDTLEWLEDFLNKYEGTILVVSHDRYFLDKVTNKTVLIENGKSIVFHGNYSYYLKENELRIDRLFKDYKDQQKMIISMKRKIKQLEEWGKLAYPGGEGFFKRAENIRKRLERIDKIDKPIHKEELPISLEFDNRSGKDVLTINKYDLYIQNKLLIKNINIKIQFKEKVCIIGNNGCGKTTLIKEILNNSSDNIKIGSNIKIGYIPQQIIFDEDISVLDFTRKFYVGDESHLRSTLNKFYFHGENVFKKINKLSGGEKVRLKLLELIHKKSNLIILDEPTNHIDIYTKETLENSLKEFNGTVLFISHDRFFINQLANKILFINNNKIEEYVGNYDYYIEHRKEKL